MDTFTCRTRGSMNQQENRFIAAKNENKSDKIKSIKHFLQKSTKDQLGMCSYKSSKRIENDNICTKEENGKKLKMKIHHTFLLIVSNLLRMKAKEYHLPLSSDLHLIDDITTK